MAKYGSSIRPKQHPQQPETPMPPRPPRPPQSREERLCRGISDFALFYEILAFTFGGVSLVAGAWGLSQEDIPRSEAITMLSIAATLLFSARMAGLLLRAAASGLRVLVQIRDNTDTR